MSTNWVKDINEMHKKFGVHDWMKNELENNEWSRLQKFLNFSTPTGNILTDATNLNLSSDFDMADAGAKYIFEVWSPDQGANIFIYYVGAFK